MTREELFGQIRKKRSFLCVGLDTDIYKIPDHLRDREDPVFEFNRQVIDATSEYCVAYKPNLAFYEASGTAGWESLKKTIDYIPEGHFIIADAKRGDIGNTSGMYARAFFEQLNCDAVTVAPYMGEDSVKPFLGYPGKWAVLLALTSNKGASDFQLKQITDGNKLYEAVLRISMSWGTKENTMYVVGATQVEELQRIREIVPAHFLLVPGVGAQGGSLEEVAEYGMNDTCGLLVNSSRGIIYAGDGENFAAGAAEAARTLQKTMENLLLQKRLI